MPETSGLAHVATASFLASRAVPTGGSAVALAGGVALARAAQRGGLKAGWGASLAAMLQTVAIMGPARISVPFTQAISAPVVGRMEARGRSALAQGLAVAAIRIVSNTAATIFYAWLILGLDAYTRSYERLLGWLPLIPDGRAGALLATALGIVAWTVLATVVQVAVYRRGLRRWPAEGTPEGAAPAPVPADPSPGPDDESAPAAAPGVLRFDPRAVTAAAAIAFAVLLAGTGWLLIGAVSLWLAVAWVAARGDRRVVRPGLILTAVLVSGTFVFGLVGGLGLELTVRRTLRAALLVLVATWLRYAAGEAGLREVFRRLLHRVRRVPGAAETSAILDGLGSTGALAASGRRLIARLDGVPREPVALADAVLAWVAGEAGRHPPVAAAPARALRARGSDRVLVALAAATAIAVPFAA
jgi:hypothetical protein